MFLSPELLISQLISSSDEGVSAVLPSMVMILDDSANLRITP
jgi:hypothetical protein